MKTSTTVFIGMAIIGLLFAARYIPTNSPKPNNEAVSGEVAINATELAKYLTQKGVKMYGASTCHACAYQKELFGDAWQYISYVECTAPDGGQIEACLATQITAYPTWEFPDGENVVGVMPLSDLANKSSFKK